MSFTHNPLGNCHNPSGNWFFGGKVAETFLNPFLWAYLPGSEDTAEESAAGQDGQNKAPEWPQGAKNPNDELSS